jgi:hypothetical protein
LLKSTKVTDNAGKETPVKDLRPGTKLVLTRSVEDDNTAIQIQVLREQKKEER